MPIHAGFVEEPQATHKYLQVTHQVSEQVKALLLKCTGEMNRVELMLALALALALKDRVNFRDIYLQPALEQGLLEMTQPDSPRSPTQKYRLTAFGKHLLASQQPHSTD